MKSAIIAICLLIPLVIIFIIINRHEFHSNDVAVVQIQEENITKEKTALVEIKTGAITTTMGESVGISLEPESNIASKLIPTPIAVPQISPEEAKRINDEIIISREPFYDLYRGNTFDTVSFEGTVKAVSTIPDPQKSDYPNCLYSLFVEIDSIYSSGILSDNIACEVVINAPCFKNNKILKNNVLFPGDKISCECAEFDAMPQAILETQVSDDIQSYEHQQYFATTIKKIEDFHATGKKSFAKRIITILPIQSLSRDENAARLRKERIQSEISFIENELKRHGGSFAEWKKEYKPIGEKYKELCNKEWEGWINDSYFSAVGGETTYTTKEFLEGILPYKQYLEENNIDLIIVRIPSRGDFAARVLASDEFYENPAWIEHYYECLKNDIEIVDQSNPILFRKWASKGANKHKVFRFLETPFLCVE